MVTSTDFLRINGLYKKSKNVIYDKKKHMWGKI